MMRLSTIFVNFFFFLGLILCSTLFAQEYDKTIKKYFSEKKLESIEGIWIKTLANQGPPGCVTLFYKVDQNLFHQMHIESCFVMNKLTGKQVKKTANTYEGENAVYFYDGSVNWGQSDIKLADDYNSFIITHGSFNNKFTEKWERLWPENFNTYNNLQD